MPNDKHLFVNMSHYQERPDPKLRHKIASHAARHGPNGSLAFKPSEAPSDASLSANVRHASAQVQSSKTRRSASISSSTLSSSPYSLEYEDMVSRFDGFCACTDTNNGRDPRGKTKMVHSDDCSLMDDYFDLCDFYELPFRVDINTLFPGLSAEEATFDDGLVAQCLLMAGQAAVDGLNPAFKGKPSKKTLTLQQKALSAMQKVIKTRPTTVDDSLIIGSAIHMATSAYFDDTDAYKAHKSSFQKLVDHHGGTSQTKALRVAKTITNLGETSLALYRHMAQPRSSSSSKKSGPQFPVSAPLKLKYNMPPFTSDVLKNIDRLSSGFRPLAKASKLSIQALQVISLLERWTSHIDQSINGDTDQNQLLSDSPTANAQLLDLYAETAESQRLAAFLLISLPIDGAHMKLERCLCLGILNLLHSVSIWPYPVSVRNELITDFLETLFSCSPKTREEEDCLLWLGIAVANEWRQCVKKVVEWPLLARHGIDTAGYCQFWASRSKQLMDWVVIKHERAQDWESLTKICVKFLWLRRLQGEWMATWKDAMSRRLKNMPRKKG